MARVFVSHAGEDVRLAVDVCGWLVEAGHEVFLDRDLRDGIAVGEEWQQRLHERLRWADAMVCLVTAAYVRSTWCAMELGIAQSRGSRILPIQAEDQVVHPALASVQYMGPNAAPAALVEALRRVDAAGGSGWPDDRSPFPGLRPFDVDQHQVFFGRGAEVSELAETLRSPAERADAAVLLVVGPSGCGKSSLARAGLLPVMAAERGWWTLAPMLPGVDPVAALVREVAAAARILGVEWTVAEVHQRLKTSGLAELADELLLAAPFPRRRRLLVVVDQFEELLTQTPPRERARFAELLGPALRGPIQVVGTLRPEFLDQLLVSSELAGLVTHTYTVRPLLRDALPAVIEQPARLAGLDIDEDLVARLVADTDGGEALPLLAYTLSQLAEGLGHGGRLRMSRYEELGGVHGTLTRQANAAIEEAMAANGRSRGQVIKELLRLVTVDEQGHPTRWRVRRNDLPAPVMTELDAFVARRLLTTDTENGETVVGVAHEVFLSAWSPLAAAITAAASGLRARRAVEQAATEWVEDRRPPARLWERGQLAAAVGATGAHLVKGNASRRLAASSGKPAAPKARQFGVRPRRQCIVGTDRVELSALARDFLRASILRDRRRRRRGVTILSALLVLTLGAAGLALVQQRTAEERQQVATARQLLAQAQTSLHDDPRTAIQLGEAALSIHRSPETRVGLINTMLSTRFRKSFETQTSSLNAAAFASNGRTLATASVNTVTLWDLGDPSRPVRRGELLTKDIGVVLTMATTPDGSTLATADEDGTVILWNLTDPANPKRLGQPPTEPNSQVWAVAFAPNGRTLATASNDGTVTLWDVSDPAHPTPLGAPLTEHASGANAVAFSPDGRTLVTAGISYEDPETGRVDATTLLWDLNDPTHPARLGVPLTGHTREIHAVAFAPDGRTLATASYDGTTILWNVTDPASPIRLGDPLREHTGSVLAFAPDGRSLATAGGDGTAIRWDLTDLAHPNKLGLPLSGHDAPVTAAAFAPDGKTLATASGDRTAILWDLTDAGRPHELGDTLPLAGRTLALTPDGRLLATVSADGGKDASLWDLTDPGHPTPLGAPITLPPYQVLTMALAPDGRIMVTAGGDAESNTGMATLWDLSDPIHPTRLGDLTGHEAIDELAFTADGRTMATASRDGTALLWDLTNPAHPTRLGDPLPHTGWVTAVSLAPNGRTLATTDDRTAILWDLSDPTHPRRLGDPITGHADTMDALAFAPDGRTLATTSRDRTTILWDLSDPAHPTRLGNRLTQNAPVTAAAFAPDGHTLATTGEDGTATLWDLSEPAHPRRLGDPEDPLMGNPVGATAGVAFSPDSRTVVTASDRGATIWDLNGLNDVRIQPMRQACAITEHGLDPTEWTRYISDLPHIDSCAQRSPL
jgi:WD40 repeat protein